MDNGYVVGSEMKYLVKMMVSLIAGCLLFGQVAHAEVKETYSVLFTYDDSGQWSQMQQLLKDAGEEHTWSGYKSESKKYFIYVGVYNSRQDAESRQQQIFAATQFKPELRSMSGASGAAPSQSVEVATGPVEPPQPVAPAKQDPARLLKVFQQRFPQVEIVELQAAAVPGIFQVETSAGELLYVSADGKHIFTGDLLDISGPAMVNLSENYRSEKRVDALKALKDKDLVVYPAKEEKGEVLVFTDTSCGYCRKFHSEVAEINDLGITVKYVAWPRYGVQSPAGQTMVNVWCSEDRGAAMTKAKSNEPVTVPAGRVCEQNTIQDQINLGHQIGVKGTPAVFGLDGRQLGGYMKAGQLAQQLGIR